MDFHQRLIVRRGIGFSQDLQANRTMLRSSINYGCHYRSFSITKQQ